MIRKVYIYSKLYKDQSISLIVLISYSNSLESLYICLLYEAAAEGEPRTAGRVRVRCRIVRNRARNTATIARVAMDFVMKQIDKTRSNEEFLLSMNG